MQVQSYRDFYVNGNDNIKTVDKYGQEVPLLVNQQFHELGLKKEFDDDGDIIYPSLDHMFVHYCTLEDGAIKFAEHIANINVDRVKEGQKALTVELEEVFKSASKTVGKVILSDWFPLEWVEGFNIILDDLTHGESDELEYGDIYDLNEYKDFTAHELWKMSTMTPERRMKCMNTNHYKKMMGVQTKEEYEMGKHEVEERNKVNVEDIDVLHQTPEEEEEYEKFLSGEYDDEGDTPLVKGFVYDDEEDADEDRETGSLFSGLGDDDGEDYFKEEQQKEEENKSMFAKFISGVKNFFNNPIAYDEEAQEKYLEKVEDEEATPVDTVIHSVRMAAKPKNIALALAAATAVSHFMGVEIPFLDGIVEKVKKGLSWVRGLFGGKADTVEVVSDMAVEGASEMLGDYIADEALATTY